MKKLFAFALCLTALLILCTITASAVVNKDGHYTEEAKKIDEIQAQIRTCIQALERIKTANLPKPQTAANGTPFDFDNPDASSSADAVADEISHNLEALVGTTEDEATVKAVPHHPNSDTTSKFANLQFGRNYDPAQNKPNNNG